MACASSDTRPMTGNVLRAILLLEHTVYRAKIEDDLVHNQPLQFLSRANRFIQTSDHPRYCTLFGSKAMAVQFTICQSRTPYFPKL